MAELDARGARSVVAAVRARSSAVVAGGSYVGVAPEPRTWTRKDLRHTSAVVLIRPRRRGATSRRSARRGTSRTCDGCRTSTCSTRSSRTTRPARTSRAPRASREALASHAPFPCALSRRARFFEHRGSVTAWRAPEDVDAIASSAPKPPPRKPPPPRTPPRVAALQAALESAFPFADDLGAIGGDGFVPHLSVGQWRADAPTPTPSSRRRSRRPTRVPATRRVPRTRCISGSRPSDVAPFRIRARVPLGGGEPTLLPVAPGGDKDGGGEWWTRARRPPPPPPGEMEPRAQAQAWPKEGGEKEAAGCEARVAADNQLRCRWTSG